MKTLPLISIALIALLLTACSSNDYGKINYQESTNKKPLINDQQLLISLLKRPTTADQIMMEQFVMSQYQPIENQQALPHVGYISIKGNKDQTPIYKNTSNDWAFSLYQTNFVRLSGPN